jgi:hypothetical protein
VRADVLTRHQIDIELEGTDVEKFRVDAGEAAVDRELCWYRHRPWATGLWPQGPRQLADEAPQGALRSGFFSAAACQASINARARELTSSTRIPGL